MRVIDVHSHVIPGSLVQSLAAGQGPDGAHLARIGGVSSVVHRQGYRYPLSEEFYDVEARLRTMDDAGVDLDVLSIAPPFFMYWLPSSEAVQVAARINDGIASMVASAPDRFIGLATLPLQDPAAAASELTRSVSELGLRGAEIGAHVDGHVIDDLRFGPVFETASALDVPLMIHPSYAGPQNGLEDFYLTNLLGNPEQTTLCASRLILSGMLDAIPSLKLVLVHGGGFLPYQIGRLDRGFAVRAEAGKCSHPPSHYLNRFYFDTLTHSAKATEALAAIVGIDRVVYGSDRPFDMGGPGIASQLSRIRQGSGGAWQQISHANAESLFGMEKEIQGA